MEPDRARMGIAFGLVVLAGLCAPLGACVVVFMRKSHTGLLAASIALAAGVMVFISLTEVLTDSAEQLLHHKSWGRTVTHLYIYLAFFAGVVLCRLLDYFADALIHLINKFSWTRSTDSSADLCAVAAVAEQQLCSMHDSIHANPKDASHKGLHASKDGTTSDLEQADAFSTGAGVKVQHGLSISQDGSSGSEPALAIITTAPPEDDHDRAVAAAVGQLQDESCGHLVRTSILVWLALSLHNIPEGLATFVGYMSSPHLGVTVAVAIAIHNIPEGIALGVPIFFATGSKWKAIGWAATSGLAEPLGALIGLALQLTGNLNPVAMGIIMAMVAGIMTGIAFQELLPRALSFDPSNKYTTPGVFVGMGIMAISLVLLSLWDTST